MPEANHYSLPVGKDVVTILSADRSDLNVGLIQEGRDTRSSREHSFASYQTRDFLFLSDRMSTR